MDFMNDSNPTPESGAGTPENVGGTFDDGNAYTPAPAPAPYVPASAPGGAPPPYTPLNTATPVPYAPPSPIYDSPEQPETLSVWDYIWPQLLAFIPGVGAIATLIVYLVFSFGSSNGPNRRNFARAQLILILVGFVIGLLALLAMGGTMYALFRGVYSDYSYYAYLIR